MLGFEEGFESGRDVFLCLNLLHEKRMNLTLVLGLIGEEMKNLWMVSSDQIVCPPIREIVVDSKTRILRTRFQGGDDEIGSSGGFEKRLPDYLIGFIETGHPANIFEG